MVLAKDDCKITISFEQIQNFKVSHFSMAKVKKTKYHNAYALAMSVFVIDTPLPRVLFIVLLIPAWHWLALTLVDIGWHWLAYTVWHWQWSAVTEAVTTQVAYLAAGWNTAVKCL